MRPARNAAQSPMRPPPAGEKKIFLLRKDGALLHISVLQNGQSFVIMHSCDSIDIDS